MIRLRSYQQEAVRAVKAALSKKHDCLLVAPCAAGKTVIFSEIVRWLHTYGRKTLILLDRENLVSQTAARIRDYLGAEGAVGVACASVSSKKDLDAQVIVASRQTLAPMLRNGSGDLAVNLAILDEAHLVHPRRGQYKEILERLTANYHGMRILGCTATPYRLKGGNIYGPQRLFTCLDHTITTEELLRENYLVPLVWKVKQSDLNAQLDRVRKSSTGELNETEQAEILGQEVYVRGVYDAWREHAVNRKTAVFALNIEHAGLIRDVFETNGVRTWLIHSRMAGKDVQAAIEEFRRSEGVMVNVGILTIGSDIPSISCVILARRTMSTALFFQIVGRGARLFPGKSDCLVIDLCGNAFLHGIDPDNPIRQQQHEGDADDVKIKLCPMCDHACSLNARRCKVCDFAFPIEQEGEEGGDGLSIADGHAPPELVEFKGFETKTCTTVRYYRHQARFKPVPSVRAEYHEETGRIAAKQWLCPQHSAWAKKKAGFYWIDMGGRWPIPKTVDEWLRRAKTELAEGPVRVTMAVDGRGRFPEVKKVERITDTEGLHGSSGSIEA